MALIACPNCGKNVSDKAATCPGCGLDFHPEKEQVINTTVICQECGAEYDKELVSCPNCGCPAPKDEPIPEPDIPQKVEVTRVSISEASKSKLKKTGILCTGLAVIVIIVIIGFFIKNQQSVATYKENLETVCGTMLNGASKAESAGNLIKSVWYNAIHEEDDYKTDKYTKDKYGYFVDDFNAALGNLFSDSSFASQITFIEDNQKAVNDLMKKLASPPKEYTEAYSALSTYYDAYIELTNLATNPSGSYNSFSSSFNAADTAVYNAYQKMKLYLE